MPRPAKVWLVENRGDSPGRISGVFATEAAARKYAEAHDDYADVTPRNVHTKQPKDKEYAE
ncbi:hypothetical protein [Microcystis phage Mel-JY34]